MPSEELGILVNTAQDVEKLGMIGLLFLMFIATLLGGIYMYRSFIQCKKEMKDQADEHHQVIVNMLTKQNP